MVSARGGAGVVDAASWASQSVFARGVESFVLKRILELRARRMRESVVGLVGDWERRVERADSWWRKQRPTPPAPDYG
jgi:hypothetical protein